MARFDRMRVLNAIAETGLVPIFYHPDPEIAQRVVGACAEGGAQVVEYTNRGDRALGLFNGLIEWAESRFPWLALGVGSVQDAPTAALYIAAGANFVVSPILNPESVRLCNRRKVAHIPGCGTVSEISEAEELGCEIVKLFPAGEMGGPSFVKSMLAPMPWSRLMPTGGVDLTADSIKSWIEAGALCVGMGSKLITKELIAAGDYAGITENVKRALEWVKWARGG